MVLANRYFKGVRSPQISIFSPNTVFHSLHRSQESQHHSLSFSIFFDLRLATGFSHQSLKSSNRPGNRFCQGNYHHISFIRAIKKGVLTMLIQKICYKGLSHLQKIVLQPFSANCELHTTIANLNIQKWHVYIMDVREGNFNEITLFSQGERLIRRCSNC